MANTYFQFKQFTVHQDRCTLKVSTDSCIFGAWVAEMSGAGSALDIGAGTGLLMLLLAQQWKGNIDGIEIDKSSFEQAAENIQAPPWGGRLRLFQGDITSAALPAVYDLIVSNPPFYEGDLTSPSPRKNLAKHDTGLTLDGLLNAADRFSAPNGRLAVLLPWSRASAFELLAGSRGWGVVKKMGIRQTPAHDYFRATLLLEKNYTGDAETEALIIHDPDRVYSDRMISLMRPYYLHL